MFEYSEELRTLQRQIDGRNAQEAELEKLCKQEKILAQQVEELKKAFRHERRDVRRLEGVSLEALVYHLNGRMEEKLETERREAQEVQEKLETAARELDDLRLKVQSMCSELAATGGCEARYKQLLTEKCAYIKKSGGPDADKIQGKERTLDFLAGQERQLLEAITAGKAALAGTNYLLDCMDSAANWGTWDMVGGGLLVDLAKCDKLDEARAAAKALQPKLMAFEAKLYNVSIRACLQFSLNGMLRGGDGLGDSFYSDMAALDRINRAKEQVIGVQNQIRGLLSRLDHSLGTTRKKKDKTKAALDKMLVSMD